MAKLEASGCSEVSRWYRKVCYITLKIFIALYYFIHRFTLQSKTCSWLLLIMEDASGHCWYVCLLVENPTNATCKKQVVDIKNKRAEYYDSYHKDSPEHWESLR